MKTHTLLLISLLAAASASAQTTAGHTSAVKFLRTYCLDCHTADKHKGDYDIEPLLKTTSLKERTEDWEDALKQIASGEMPPKKAKLHPTPEQVKALTGWVEQQLIAVSATAGTLARRLNRAEYNNTMRDLLLVDARPADVFPQDLGRNGFDNVAEAQSVSPLLLEKYVRAARQALDAAIVTKPEPERINASFFMLNRDQYKHPESLKPEAAELAKLIGKGNNEWRRAKGDVQFMNLDWSSGSPAENGRISPVREGKGRHGYEVVLPHSENGGRRGEIHFENPLPYARYRVTARAYAEKVRDKKTGQELEPAGACLLGFDVNGKRMEVRDVPLATEPKTFVFEFSTTMAKSSVTLAAATQVNKSLLDRVPRLVLCDAKLEGPLYDVWPPAYHREIFGDDGKRPLPELLQRFISRAFRRPVQSDEVAKYQRIAESEIAAGTKYEEAVKVALQAVLVSPNFLFLVEDTRADRRLSDYELASRLSYFLWSSMPDARLLDLAAKGRLHDPATLKAEVTRMIADPRSESLVENFAAQWIGFRRLGDIAPDPTVFKSWDEELRRSMREESENFFRHVLRENLSVLNFLDSDFAFLNDRLARHYGIAGIASGDFQKVSLKPGVNRGGLITQGGVLTLASQPTRSSPVFRGKFVIANLFNREPPPPPANVPPIDEAGAKTPTSLREQLEHHRADPNCAACHKKIDPWGLALEGFDGIGVWRDVPQADTTTTLDTGVTMTGVADLKKALLARKDEFATGLAEKLLIYATGHSLKLRDKRAVTKIVEQTKTEGYKFQSLILATVLSPSFQER
jgi:cytochrome c553